MSAMPIEPEQQATAALRKLSAAELKKLKVGATLEAGSLLNIEGSEPIILRLVEKTIDAPVEYQFDVLWCDVRLTTVTLQAGKWR